MNSKIIQVHGELVVAGSMERLGSSVWESCQTPKDAAENVLRIGPPTKTVRMTILMMMMMMIHHPLARVALAPLLLLEVVETREAPKRERRTPAKMATREAPKRERPIRCNKSFFRAVV